MLKHLYTHLVFNFIKQNSMLYVISWELIFYNILLPRFINISQVTIVSFFQLPSNELYHSHQLSNGRSLFMVVLSVVNDVVTNTLLF